MKIAKLISEGTTIRFAATLQEAPAILVLPAVASAKIPRGKITVEGIINCFPFRAELDAGKNGQRLQVNEGLRRAAGAKSGDIVAVEITRVGDAPEVRMPADLHKALADNSLALAAWHDITPNARRDWILWLATAKQEETRNGRIAKACDMLSSGKRRVCCFGGLNWLTKDHKEFGETWGALPR